MRLLQLICTLLLLLAGTVLSVLTLHEHAALKVDPTHSSTLCSFSETLNCGPVISSSYSELFGIPLGVYGLLLYLLLMVLYISSLIRANHEKDVLRCVMFVVTTLSVLASFILFLVSKLIIKALCPLCLSIYLVNILLFLLSYLSIRSNKAGSNGIVSALREGVVYSLKSPLHLISPPCKSLFNAWCITIACLLVSLSIVALPGYFYRTAMRAHNTREPLSEMIQRWQRAPLQDIPIVTQDALHRDYVKGDPNAPITIVEFSDYECPACRDFVPTVATVVEKYRDKVYVVHKDFPIDNSCNPLIPHKAHEHACRAAVYARCAGEQGKFWHAAEYLFALEELTHTSSAAQVQEALEKGNNRLGLDTVAMQECLTSGRAIEKIKSDITLADNLKLMGTPSIWVNGRKLPENSDVLLAAVIESILKSKPTP